MDGTVTNIRSTVNIEKRSNAERHSSCSVATTVYLDYNALDQSKAEIIIIFYQKINPTTNLLHCKKSLTV